MKSLLPVSVLLLMSILPISVLVHAQSVRLSPEIAVESRFFVDDPQFDDQFENEQLSLVLSGDLRWVSKDRNSRFTVEPFLRLDQQDSRRSYFDLREGSISHRSGDWDFLVGVSQVFWGVAESRNVVDVINQFDTVEDFDQVEKLGQPMFRVGRRTSIGRFEGYYLPYFREQRLPGEDGRLRFSPTVDTDSALYERGGEEWAGDVALRYTNTFGRFDLGLHGFYGTSRSPGFIRSADNEALIPIYQELTQGGLDLQYTDGAVLLKLEAAAVDVGGDRFASAVAGFEYTFFDIQGSGVDVGLIGEYLYDGREGDQLPVAVFDDDVFAGLRATANDPQDTTLLAGAIVDRNNDAVIGTVEFQRRIGARMLLEVEGRYFDGGSDPFLLPFDQDSHLTLRLTRYF